MATITIEVKQGGAALANAKIILGDVVAGGITTDESGTITKVVDDGYSILVPITILHVDIPSGRRDFGIHLLEAGKMYLFVV